MATDASDNIYHRRHHRTFIKPEGGSDTEASNHEREMIGGSSVHLTHAPLGWAGATTLASRRQEPVALALYRAPWGSIDGPAFKSGGVLHRQWPSRRRALIPSSVFEPCSASIVRLHDNRLVIAGPAALNKLEPLRG